MLNDVAEDWNLLATLDLKLLEVLVDQLMKPAMFKHRTRVRLIFSKETLALSGTSFALHFARFAMNITITFVTP